MSFLETREGRRAAQRTSPEARDYMNDVHDGWQVVGPRHAGWIDGGFGDRCGLVAHRGVLHPDEYVDHDALRPRIEAELGFTLDELRSVYRRGRLSAAQRARRARMDARLLAVAESGGTMALLGRLLGFSVHDSNCTVITNALARARAAEQFSTEEEAARVGPEGRPCKGGPRRLGSGVSSSRA